MFLISTNLKKNRLNRLENWVKQTNNIIKKQIEKKYSKLL